MPVTKRTLPEGVPGAGAHINTPLPTTKNSPTKPLNTRVGGRSIPATDRAVPKADRNGVNGAGTGTGGGHNNTNSNSTNKSEKARKEKESKEGNSPRKPLAPASSRDNEGAGLKNRRRVVPHLPLNKEKDGTDEKSGQKNGSKSGSKSDSEEGTGPEVHDERTDDPSLLHGAHKDGENDRKGERDGDATSVYGEGRDKERERESDRARERDIVTPSDDAHNDDDFPQSSRNTGRRHDNHADNHAGECMSVFGG